MSEPAPVHAGRRADLPLSAALRLLLEPARLRPATATSSTPRTGCACSARPRSSASCSSTSPAASRCVRDDLEALVEEARRARPLHQPDHQRRPAAARAARAPARRSASTTCRSRSRTSRAAASDRIAGLRSFERKLRGRALGEGARPAAHDQRRAAPRQPRPRAPRSSRWPSRWTPIGSSWPTRSTSAGRSSTAQALLPTREQLERARATWPRAARQRLRGRMEVLFVTPDYYAEFPKACMDGWGRRFIVISPDGLVLPCHAAHTLPGPDVRQRPATARSARSGATRPASTRSAARPGCPSPAGAASAASRRLRRLPLPGVSTSPATRRPPTRCARCRRSTS